MAMLRFTAIVLSGVVVSLLFIVPKAISEGQKTVSSPVSTAAAEEHHGPPSGESINITPVTAKPIDIAVGSSLTINLSKTFKTIHVADPNVVDVLPINDQTMVLVGKDVGITDIDVFGEKSDQIAKFAAFIGICSTCKVVEIHNLPGFLVGKSTFECAQSGGCSLIAPKQERPPPQVININPAPK
jgi:Pilus formation protein N terminal region